MDISKIINDPNNAILFSILLGIGLASMFKKVCKNGNCVIIKGPKMDDINHNHYRIDNDCFKYTPYVVDCDELDKNSKNTDRS
jgi:hypothetical protein